MARVWFCPGVKKRHCCLLAAKSEFLKKSGIRKAWHRHLYNLYFLMLFFVSKIFNFSCCCRSQVELSFCSGQDGSPAKNQYLVKRVVDTFVGPVTAFDAKPNHSNNSIVGPSIEHTRDVWLWWTSQHGSKDGIVGDNHSQTISCSFQVAN